MQHKTLLTLATLLSRAFSLPPNSTGNDSTDDGAPHLAVEYCAAAGNNVMCCPNGSPHGSKYFFDPGHAACVPVSGKCSPENTFCCGQYRSGLAGTYYNTICHQAEIGSTEHSYNATDPDDIIEAIYIFGVANCQEACLLDNPSLSSGACLEMCEVYVIYLLGMESDVPDIETSTNNSTFNLEPRHFTPSWNKAFTHCTNKCTVHMGIAHRDRCERSCGDTKCFFSDRCSTCVRVCALEGKFNCEATCTDRYLKPYSASH